MVLFSAYIFPLGVVGRVINTGGVLEPFMSRGGEINGPYPEWSVILPGWCPLCLLARSIVYCGSSIVHRNYSFWDSKIPR